MTEAASQTNDNQHSLWRHVWWRLAIGVVLLVLTLFYLPIFTSDYGQDFAAAKGWWEGNDPNGRTLDLLGDSCPDLSRRYAEIAPDMQTAHPPMATLLALPSYYLGWPLARLVWLLVNWVVVLAAWQFRQVPLSACLATIPLWVFVLGLGTHEALVFLLLALTFSADERRSILAGIPLGLSIALKAYPAVLLLGFADNRRWKPILIALLTCGICTLVGELTLGLGVHRDWLAYLPVNTAKYLDHERNASLVRIFHKMLPFTPALLLSPLLAILLTLPLLLPRRKPLELERFVPIILLASPLAWRYYFTALSLQQLRGFDLACLFLPPTILLLGMAGILPSAGWNRWLEFIAVLMVQLPLLIVALRLWYSAVKDRGLPDDQPNAKSNSGMGAE